MYMIQAEDPESYINLVYLNIKIESLTDRGENRAYHAKFSGILAKKNSGRICLLFIMP